MSDLTFEILKVAVTLCVLVITAYVAPYYKALVEGERYSQLSEIVDAAVMTAEQTMDTLSGASKKAAVISWVADWVKRHNIEVTAEQIDQLIESAVYAVKRARECKRDDGEVPSV